jgi:hypothetical protein
MKTSKRRRFERVQQAVSRLPYRADVLEDAFALFCLSGELPQEHRLAESVTQRALRGGGAHEPSHLSELERLILKVVPPDGEAAQDPTVREHLFDEAVYGPDYVRRPARLAIEYLVGKGGDVCATDFGADKGFPKHASMGWHVLGFPERLAKPPYEKQARRLFARLDDYRERVTCDDEAFFDVMADATVALLWKGELPVDAFLREGALLQAEFDCLWEHARGRDVAELMAAFDAVARAKGKGREAAVARLQHLLRSSRGT